MIREWLNGWRAHATIASQPSLIDELIAEAQAPTAGSQRFIRMEDMTDQDWLAAGFSARRDTPRPSSVFSTKPDPASFPMPR